MNRIRLFFVGAALVQAAAAHAAFTETSRRYVAPRDLFNLMQQKFPVLSDPQKAQRLKPSCWSVGSYNANLIGAVNPAIGAPASEQPVTGFVRWLGTCGKQVIELQFADLKAQPANQKLRALYFPAALIKSFGPRLDRLPWGALNGDQRKDLIRFEIEHMIGPEETVIDLGFSKNMDELIGTVNNAIDQKSASVTEVVQQALLALILREEFITY